MAIPIPTVDDFKDTTVMRVIRKVVNYLIQTIVPGINTVDTTANNALSIAQQAQATANANTQKIEQIIAQFNTMVDYVGTDPEINTGTAPQKITEE